MITLSPSLLAADFNILGRQIREITRAGAKYLHIDVMDGRFVPNLSVGFPVIESLRRESGLIFDLHLLMEEPERFVERFAEAGADVINFHLEAVREPLPLIKRIRSLGKKAAVSLKPGTPVEDAFPFAGEVGMILLMSVEPGFGGQAFLPESLGRAERLRGHIAEKGYKTDIEMDGGITPQNVRDVINAGVNVIVAGSSVFGEGGIKRNLREFMRVIDEFN